MKLTSSSTTLLRSGIGLTLAAPVSLLAAGIELYEIATPDVGLASAGYASRAQDASTVFKNPAGMNLLVGTQVQAGLQLTYGDVEFSPNSDTSARLGTENGGNAVGALPALSLFYVQELGEKWRVGFGTLSYFGLLQNYDDNWVGRYYVQEGGVVGVSLMPTISYEVNDWLSVGAGLNAMYGYMKNELAVNNLDPLIGDGQLSLSDRTWGFGANAGVMIRLSEKTRVGATYLSRVNLDFEDTPTFSNLGPGLSGLLANTSQLNLGVTVPQSVMASVYHQLTEKLAVMVDLGWQNWEQFGQVQVGVDAPVTTPEDPKAFTTNLNYQDTWHGAVGVQYQLSEKWQLTSGVAYDSSAVSDEDRTVTVPMGKALRVGLGVQWQFSPKLSLGAAYEFLWAGDMSVDQGKDDSLRGRVAGSYDNAWFSFFTLNLNWKL
ncbi:MAG TPA: outer membrane protein transport protein [Verrucomicrobiota bacterium]|nr:outer membrane protein transport protein [Verrucomicrobiota bacterium]